MGIDRNDPCTMIFMPFEPASAGSARRMLVADLADAAPREVVHDAQVVLSELISNGLRHGEPDAQHRIEVGWRLLEGCVRVYVCDAGRASQLRPSEHNPGSERGRGLTIVDALCERWSIDNSSGTRVTADIGLSSST